MQVAEWKRYTTSGVGYGVHLYTRALPDGESDEIDKWLNNDFESPAAHSLAKAVSGDRLCKEDHRLLARFVAAQIVRTPAFLVRNLPRWQRETAEYLENLDQTIKRKLQEAKSSGRRVMAALNTEKFRYYPIRVSQEKSPDGVSVIVRTETVVGRGTWVFAMRHLLTKTLDCLTNHHWTILSADKDLPWFTTDDPVLRLNFRNARDYDFGGGWDVPNTNIMLPLSPRHLLFAEVGRKPPIRGTVLPRQQAQLLRKFMAENAHRYLFSPTPDSTIAALRPRLVDQHAYTSEKAQWQRWNAEQGTAERQLFAK